MIRYAETNLSTKEAPTQEKIRLSQPLAERTKETARKRAKTSVRVRTMLPAPHRLRQFRDFQRVYRDGKSTTSTLVRVCVASNTVDHTRFGVVIPNKLIKKATQRNRKKRQVRAALQALLPHVQPGLDVVVSAQAGLVGAEYADILADLRNTLTKARVL